jgi:diguanylate cyclase (GGDEF)-like protein/PAS domain S-box-containing protein
VKKYHLSDLFDISLIQKLADSNYRAAGLPMSIVDAYDSSVLVYSGWNDICRNFHRANITSRLQCFESDSFVKGSLLQGEELRYKCKSGLWHIAIPIIVAGQHIATMLFSQFFLQGEIPDREFYLGQAEVFGYDPVSYLAALDRAPVFSSDRIDYIMSYNRALARLISDLAEQSIASFETKKSLAESEEKYRTLIHNINIGIYRDTAEPGSGFIHCNPALVRIFGFNSEDDLMRVPAELLYVNAEDRKAFLDEIRNTGFARNSESQMRKSDGSSIWCSITASAAYDDEGGIKWMDGVVEDITDTRQAGERLKTEHQNLEMRVKDRTADLALANELLIAEIADRKKAEEMLREMSEKDYLTMIFNRRKFFELLGLEIEKASRYDRPLSLIIFDIDHFKAVNDTYGHIAGDAVLKSTATTVESVLRKSDIFARYGGEEFVILSPETTIDGALAIAEKVRASVEEHIFERGVRITLSAGVAEWSPGDTELSFIGRADRMLYSAKEAGRNRVAVNGFSAA